jgi:hypothetical protein
MFGELVEMNFLFIENDLDRFKTNYPVFPRTCAFPTDLFHCFTFVLQQIVVFEFRITLLF